MNDLTIDARSLLAGYIRFGPPSRAGDDGRRADARANPRANPDIHESVTPVPSTQAIGGEPAADVLARLRAGDQSALTLIYDTYFLTLWRIAMLRLHRPAAAEEVVHDVFLSLWIRRASLGMDLDLRVYLAAAVRNRTRDVQAHERVVHDTELLVDRAAMAPPALGQGEPIADAVLEHHEFWDAYRRALQTLTEREREAVLLRWEEDFTLEEVGRVLGLSTMGARAAILRAQRKVQTALEDYRR